MDTVQQGAKVNAGPSLGYGIITLLIFICMIHVSTSCSTSCFFLFRGDSRVYRMGDWRPQIERRADM